MFWDYLWMPFEVKLVFNGKLHKQVNGVKSNAFLIYYEKNCWQNCPSDFKSCYYCFDDGIYALFASPEHLEAFYNFLNGLPANMSFAIEIEKQNSESCLDTQINGEDKKKL